MSTLNNGVLDGIRRIGVRVRDLVIDGGLPGAPLGYRLRGATQSGAPTTGTWKAGDQVPDRNGVIWICMSGGTGPAAAWVVAGSSVLAPKASPAFTGTVTSAGPAYFGGGSPWFDLASFPHADPTGATDSTLAFTAAAGAIAACVGLLAPATNTRTATAGVYMGPGTWKVTSDILIQSTIGFRLFGAGADITTIRASGAGFTTAVLNIDGALDGVFESFTITGDGTENVPAAINLTWTTAAARSTSGNCLQNIRIRNLNFVTGISLAGVGARQLDNTTLRNITITGQQTGGAWTTSGYWQNGIVFGNGTYGNIYNQYCYDVSAAGCYYGYNCNTSSFALWGAEPAYNAVDFFIIPSAQCTISNVQSQNGGQFITQTSCFSPNPVSVSDCEFVSSYVTTPDVINLYGGVWDIRNFTAATYSGTGGAVAPVINVLGAASTRPAVVNLTNVTLSNTFPAGIGTPNSQARIAVTNYSYYNNGTAAYAVTPWSYWNGTAWITQASATGVQAPALTASGLTGATAGARLVGGTVSGAPTTGTFTAGDVDVDQTGAVWVYTGSAWVAAAVVAPNVQFFTAGGTWTKPAGAQTVFASALGSAGGAGSGASGASGTVLNGGAGGGTGIYLQRQFIAADLPGTVPITIGAGGTGGASVTGTTASTAGNPGTAGSGCSFGTYLNAAGGGPGAGGTITAVAATGGYGAWGEAVTQMGYGAPSSSSGGAGVGINAPATGPPGGSSGGGITTAAVAGNGAAGGKSPSSNDATAGTAGVAGGASPSSGTASLLSHGSMGPAPGSGAASVTGAAQAGVNALANTGAGGSGGGASLNGNASGAGGNGGSGWVLVITYFQ